MDIQWVEKSEKIMKINDLRWKTPSFRQRLQENM